MKYYPLNDRNVLAAVDIIIKDTDRKYDECLVESFLDYIKKQVAFCHNNSSDECSPLIDRLKNYFDHEAFVMLNQARAFKILHSIVVAKAQLFSHKFDIIKPVLDSLWNLVGTVVVNNDLAAMTIMLDIFHCLLESQFDNTWLMRKTIEPPIKIKKKEELFEIEEIVSLVRYFMETSNNYHTKNKAEKVFKSLITKSIALSQNDPHILIIKQTIRELMINASSSLPCIFISIILSDAENCKMAIFETYDIPQLLQESFSVLVEKPNGATANLCKCLALSNSSKNLNDNIEKLKSKNNLEGIIVYLSNSRSKVPGFFQILHVFLLYPLISVCTDENTQVLVQKLMATRDERDFIDKNMNPKVITVCIVQLNCILDDLNTKHPLHSRSITIILETFSSFIKCHYASLQHYRNVMECCFGLIKLCNYNDHIASLYRTEVSSAFYWNSFPKDFYSSVSAIIDTVKDNYSQKIKPIIIQLLRIRRRRVAYPGVSLQEIEEHLRADLLMIVEIAFYFTDVDIMAEFASDITGLEYYIRCNDERLVQLVWDHMYKIAKETSYGNIPSSIAELLLVLDKKIEASVLDIHGIVKNSDIPDILRNLKESTIDHSGSLDIIDTIEDNRVNQHSIVDDILGFDLISDGISDCY